MTTAGNGLAGQPVMLRVRSLVRTFGSGRPAVRALRGTSFDVAPGELAALEGRSGAGKTTLLNIIGGYELSGGQQQRVAIARALANRPRLLIADEPTGQLDTQHARQIMQLLRALADSEGVTVLVATHDQAVLAIADRKLRISDGVVSEAREP